MSLRFYGYKHWTLEEIPRCFYVGKGLRSRPFHLKPHQRSHKWNAVSQRYGVRVEVCIGPVTNDEACSWEIEQIATMGTFSTCHSHNDPNDIGCNFTKGGGGSVGTPRPDVSARMKIRIIDEETKRRLCKNLENKVWARSRKGLPRHKTYKTRSDKGSKHRYPETRREPRKKPT